MRLDPIIYYAVAGLLFIAAGVALALTARRGRGRGGPQAAASSPGAADPATPDATALPADAGATLQAELTAASTQLWASALSATPFDYAVPPDQEAVMLAARQALAADPLADRYFPRRPMLMPQLLAAVNDPGAPALKLASIIAQDPVLTGNILRLANSVFFRLSSTPVESIQRAVVVCGTDGLQSLAATALVQPVFRAGSEEHSHFPAVLWERCTRASIAAELCARQWCPGERQAAQLLALLAALGPLVAYRVVQDQYRAQLGLRPAPAIFLQVIVRYSVTMAARIATLWQSPPRIVAVLRGLDPQEPLERALQAGELLATFSLLVAGGQMAEQDCAARALAAGIPQALFTAVWARLHRSIDGQ